MEVLYILVGAAVLAGGFFMGWFARDRARGADEEHVPLVQAPLHDPIEIPTAGRHIPPQK